MNRSIGTNQDKYNLLPISNISYGTQLYVILLPEQTTENSPHVNFCDWSLGRQPQQVTYNAGTFNVQIIHRFFLRCEWPNESCIVHFYWSFHQMPFSKQPLGNKVDFI